MPCWSLFFFSFYFGVIGAFQSTMVLKIYSWLRRHFWQCLETICYNWDPTKICHMDVKCLKPCKISLTHVLNLTQNLSVLTLAATAFPQMLRILHNINCRKSHCTNFKIPNVCSQFFLNLCLYLILKPHVRLVYE